LNDPGARPAIWAPPLAAGHRVEFYVDPAGQVTLKARNGDVRALKGSIRSRRRAAPSLKEISAAIGRGFAGQ